jgi:hypothetical protein
MPTKAHISMQLPIRRGLSEIEAAVYLSLSPTKFRNMVTDGRMPQPRMADNRCVWDVDEIDFAFRELPRRGSGDSLDLHAVGDSWDDFE